MKGFVGKYRELRLENCMTALEGNNFEVFLAENPEDAGKIVTEKIFPKTHAKSVSWGDSLTLYSTGILDVLKQNPEILAAAQNFLGTIPDLSNLTIYGFLVKNLLPVTLGNIIGGTFFVGIVHWFLFLRPSVIKVDQKK